MKSCVCVRSGLSTMTALFIATIAGSVLTRASYAVFARASTATIRGNLFHDCYTGGILQAGPAASPARYLFEGNRSVRNTEGGLVLLATGLVYPWDPALTPVPANALYDATHAAVIHNDLSDSNAVKGWSSGIRCMISANDSGIDAGALQPFGLDKTLRVQEMALENKLPYVQLVESAGANLLRYRVEDFVRGGNIFRNLARLSAAGLPVVTVTHGSSTAGGAYQTGLSDYIIMVRGRSRAFLAGPPLLKAATGEIATEEELGGALMHTAISGLGRGGYGNVGNRRYSGGSRDGLLSIGLMQCA